MKLIAFCSAAPLTTTSTPLPSTPAVDPAEPVLFIINAASGSHDPDATRAAIEAALQAAGRTGDLRFTRTEDLARVAGDGAAAARARGGAVVAVGGDGTINTVAQAAYTHGCALGVVPQSTLGTAVVSTQKAR